MEFISFFMSIAFYIFTSLGYYRISESLGLSNSWMSFVPVTNVYKIGEISDTLRGMQGKPDKKRRWVLPISSFVVGFLMTICLLFSFFLIGLAAEEELVFLIILGVLGIFMSFALLLIPMIVQYMCVYDVYKAYTNESTLFLILSIVVPASMPFLIFFACDPTKADKRPANNAYNATYQAPPVYQDNADTYANQNTSNNPYNASVNNPVPPVPPVPPVQPTAPQTPPSYVQPPVDAVNNGVDLNKHE